MIPCSGQRGRRDPIARLRELSREQIRLPELQRCGSLGLEPLTFPEGLRLDLGRGGLGHRSGAQLGFDGSTVLPLGVVQVLLVATFRPDHDRPSLTVGCDSVLVAMPLPIHHTLIL